MSLATYLVEFVPLDDVLLARGGLRLDTMLTKFADVALLPRKSTRVLLGSSSDVLGDILLCLESPLPQATGGWVSPREFSLTYGE